MIGTHFLIFAAPDYIVTVVRMVMIVVLNRVIDKLWHRVPVV